MTRSAGAVITSGMKTNARSYKDLLVWQKGIALAKLVYRVTRTFPSEEKFGLIAQMRRTAVRARHTTGEFIQFISHAEGSVAELDTQLILAVELKFCRDADAAPSFQHIEELRRMLNALRRKLATRS